jgi:hypothetical protein
MPVGPFISIIFQPFPSPPCQLLLVFDLGLRLRQFQRQLAALSLQLVLSCCQFEPLLTDLLEVFIFAFDGSFEAG